MKLFAGLIFLLVAGNIFSQSARRQYNAIAPGNEHTLCIKSDGTLWAWGKNNDGQLGDGTTTDRTNPTQISIDNKWVIISANNTNSAAIKSDGTLWTWGWNVWGQLGDGTYVDKIIPIQVGSDNTWIDISVGGDHMVGLKSNGTLWVWGFNGDGRLGIGTTGNGQPNQPNPVQIGTDNNWVKVSTGGDHSLSLKSDGTLWAWAKR